METTCQASYPLNSENASPPGTFTVYLSCAEMARPPTTARTPVIIGIVSILLPFIASTSALTVLLLDSSGKERLYLTPERSAITRRKPACLVGECSNGMVSTGG